MKIRKSFEINILLLIIILLFNCVSCNNKKISDVVVSCGNLESKLLPLNKNGISGKITKIKYPYLYGAFSPEIIQQCSLSKENLSVTVSVNILSDENLSKNTEDISFLMAILTDKDFNQKGNLNKKLSFNNQIFGHYAGTKKTQTIDISFEVKKEDLSCIRGIGIYSAKPIMIEKIEFSPVFYGWKQTVKGFHFGFSHLGGEIPLDNPCFGKFDISSFNDLTSSVLLRFQKNSEEYGELGKQNRVELRFYDKNTDSKGELISIRRSPIQSQVSLPYNLFQENPSYVIAEKNGNMIQSFILEKKEDLKNENCILLDPGLIPSYDVEYWRNPEFEVFAWENFPSILIFDTKNYEIQDYLFKRLAFFVEKKGWTGKLWTAEELAEEHGFNAHDYKSESLAAFFTLAKEIDFPLNDYEIYLRNLLVAEKIIYPYENGYKAGNGAVISISQESADYLRIQFIAHELYHGLYFIDKDFREEVAVNYNSVDRGELAFLQAYFEVTPSLQYDTNDSFLMQNEFMGYLMQQPVYQVSSYFSERLASRYYINQSYPELVEYIKETKAKSLTEACENLEKYVYQRWGFAAGRVSLVYNVNKS